MTRRIIAIICLLAIFMGTGARFSRADTSDAAFMLTAEQLPKVLIELGYDPVDLGSGAYEVTAGPRGAECRIRASLGQDEELLWLFAYFGELVATEALTVQGLLNLLTVNEDFGPAYFSIASDGAEPKRLYLNRVIANDHLSPSRIANGIEDLCVTAGALIRSWADRQETGNK